MREVRRSKYLFLLIGGNPLPVFVSAKVLAMPDGFVYLIHTKETSVYAENLRRVLSKSINFKPEQFHCLELNSPADQSQIHQDLADHLSSFKFLAAESLELNYTGGMKSMAVHTYEFFKEWCRKKKLNFNFSYLDPIEGCLRFAHGENYTPPASECSLTLTELLALHGRKINEAEPEAVFPLVCDLLADIAGKPGGITKIKDWNKEFTQGIKKADLLSYLNDYYSPTGFNRSTLFPDFNALQNFLRSSFQTKSLAVSNTAFLSSPNNQFPLVPILGQLALACMDTERPNIDHWTVDSLSGSLLKFLNGGWLENYVLSCLEAISADCGIQERKRNFLFNKTAVTTDAPESDVVAMQGYRLFVFSCTVKSSKEDCKLKLFEAYMRAQQIGGAEANVALVSGYPQPEHLREEVAEAWSESRNRIRIFGPQHLCQLKSYLKDWFSGR